MVTPFKFAWPAWSLSSFVVHLLDLFLVIVSLDLFDLRLSRISLFPNRSCPIVFRSNRLPFRFVFNPVDRFLLIGPPFESVSTDRFPSGFVSFSLFSPASTSSTSDTSFHCLPRRSSDWAPSHSDRMPDFAPRVPPSFLLWLDRPLILSISPCCLSPFRACLP